MQQLEQLDAVYPVVSSWEVDIAGVVKDVGVEEAGDSSSPPNAPRRAPLVPAAAMAQRKSQQKQTGHGAEEHGALHSGPSMRINISFDVKRFGQSWWDTLAR